jgi:hypothetical protein
MNTHLTLQIGKKTKRGKTISISDDCLEEIKNIVKRSQNEVSFNEASEINISTVVETACWMLINELKKQRNNQTAK